MKIIQERLCTRVYPHLDQDDEIKGFEHCLIVSFNTMSAPAHILVGGIGQFPQPTDQAVESGLAAIQAAIIGERLALDFIQSRTPTLPDDTAQNLELFFYMLEESLEEAATLIRSISKIRDELIKKVLTDYERDYMALNHPQPQQVTSPEPPAKTAAQKMLDKLQQDL